MKLIVGVNDLKTTDPKIAAELDPVASGFNATDVTRGSARKAKWICPKGHPYQARIKKRTIGGTGCPYCAGRKVWPGFNDLATADPEIAAELDTVASGFNATDVTRGSVREAKWICPNGHPYTAKICDRTAKGQGCPYCAGRKVWPGFNDLATTDPEIAAELDSVASGFKATEVTRGSNSKAAWICPKGHPYTAKICDRTAKGQGCPYCAGKKVWPGFNDLATTDPEIAAELDSVASGFKATDVTRGSHNKAVWICSKGHSYPARICKRTSDGNGCPKCKNKGEAAVLKLFDQYMVKYEREKTFANLRDKSNLRFDFACYKDDKIAVLIEIDGDQHFHPIERMGGVEKFKTLQMHDRMKNEYAQKAGIPLFRLYNNGSTHGHKKMEQQMRSIIAEYGLAYLA